jgi:putative transposase
MPQSFAQIFIHIVFSTKKRARLLDDKIINDIYPYINKILQNHNCRTAQIGGTEDHIHILCELAKNLSVSKIIEEIKTSSSKLVKTKSPMYKDFYWQHGYGAFSISPGHKEIVCNYIANQKQHHKTISYEDEFRTLLKKYNINFEEKYLLD